MCPEVSYMSEAIYEAEAAAAIGEVPVGAVAVHEGTIIARAHNLVEGRQDATQHAEIIVLQETAKLLGRWRLSDVDIYVTLEPCPMCASALILSRVRSLYYAAADERMGACGSMCDLCTHPALPAQTKVLGGILEAQSKELLQNFFQNARRKN